MKAKTLRSSNRPWSPDSEWNFYCSIVSAAHAQVALPSLRFKAGLTIRPSPPDDDRLHVVRVAADACVCAMCHFAHELSPHTEYIFISSSISNSESSGHALSIAIVSMTARHHHRKNAICCRAESGRCSSTQGKSHVFSHTRAVQFQSIYISFCVTQHLSADSRFRGISVSPFLLSSTSNHLSLSVLPFHCSRFKF